MDVPDLNFDGFEEMRAESMIFERRKSLTSTPEVRKTTVPM